MYNDKNYYEIQNGIIIKREEITKEYDNGDVETCSGLHTVAEMYSLRSETIDGEFTLIMDGADINTITDSWNSSLSSIML